MSYKLLDWDDSQGAITPTQRITENTIGTVVAVEAHKTKADVFIILGSEDSLKPRLNRFFTREASGVTGVQFWGHYCMTLGEAFTDYEERLGRGT